LQIKSLEAQEINLPAIISPKIIAKYLGIGYVKALGLVKSGDIPCVKIGNSYKVSRHLFLLWLEQPGLRKVL